MKTPTPYKIEIFLTQLLYAGSEGISPSALASIIQTQCIAKFAHVARSKGISMQTKGRYKLIEAQSIDIAIDTVNEYKIQRGENTIPRELLIRGFE